MKIIFLDFDGVITTEESHWCLDLEKMKIVKRICDETGAKIVISSSWRRRTLEETIKEITTVGEAFTPIRFLMPELVVGITTRMYAFNYGERDKHYRICRGNEIEHYVDTHSGIENYVILDDDADMLLCQADKFVKTDAREGISDKDAELAIKILKYGNKD